MLSQYHCPVVDFSFEEHPMPFQYHCPVIDIVLRTSHAFPVSLPCYQLLVLRISDAFPVSLPCYRLII